MGDKDAGIGWNLLRRRMGAYVIDMVLLFAILGPVGWLVQRLAGFSPSTGPQIWATLLLNFSLPAWAYFIASDASAGGATFGKRWSRIRVSRMDDGRVGGMQALARTAVKLLPWELVHVSAFGLARDLDHFGVAQGAGLAFANALGIAYLACAVITRGRRSVHDFVAGTHVRVAAEHPRALDNTATTVPVAPASRA